MQAQLQTEEAAPRGAELPLDARILMRLVWDHQEVHRLGFITIHQLQKASALPWPEFTQALDRLLESPRIYWTKGGGLGYTW